MRIGIDVTALPPQPVGAGNYTIHLIRSLASSEMEGELVLFAHPRGRDLIALPPGSRLEWVMVPDYGTPYRLLWEQIGLPRLVRRAGVDLLHSPHYTMPLFLSCASVVTFHDMTFFLYPQLHTPAKRIFFPPAIRMSARRADALIAVSESTRKDAIRLLGIPPDKVFAIPLGVTSDFRPLSDRDKLEAARQQYHLPEKFILYVGTVEPRKNLQLLIRAFAALAGRGVAHPLVVVGQFGWMVEEVLASVRSLGLEEKVHFVGYIPHQDLPIVYNLADVFVYPSVYEGFGLPPLEAMACGTPVITTAISSMPEHVGEAGILVPPNDEEALLQALLEVLRDRALWEKLIFEGPRRASQFTWARTATETMQVYRRVLEAT